MKKLNSLVQMVLKVAALQALWSCNKACPPPKPVEAQQPAQAASLEECLEIRPVARADTGGQGRGLLNFGFIHPQRRDLKGPARLLVTVDKFDFRKFTKNGKAIRGVGIDINGFTGPLQGKDLIGAKVEGKINCTKKRTTFSVEAEIKDAVQEDEPKKKRVWLYEVQLTLQGSNGTKEVIWGCESRDDPNSSSIAPNRLAFPVRGHWDASGKYVDHNEFGFGCMKAAVPECIFERGYTRDDGVLYQACTRMMTADYCGNGQSWTKEGTQILSWDRANVSAPPGPGGPSNLKFEAVWHSEGARCRAHWRWEPEQLRKDLVIAPETSAACLDHIGPCPAEEQASTAGEKVLLNRSCSPQPCEEAGTQRSTTGDNTDGKGCLDDGKNCRAALKDLK